MNAQILISLFILIYFKNLKLNKYNRISRQIIKKTFEFEMMLTVPFFFFWLGQESSAQERKD